jgi:hypothetical protein
MPTIPETHFASLSPAVLGANGLQSGDWLASNNHISLASNEFVRFE